MKITANRMNRSVSAEEEVHRITIEMPGGGFIDLSLDSEDRLDVNAHSVQGAPLLKVTPWSGNVIKLEVDRA